jgi:hypothetical protein
MSGTPASCIYADSCPERYSTIRYTNKTLIRDPPSHGSRGTVLLLQHLIKLESQE